MFWRSIYETGAVKGPSRVVLKRQHERETRISFLNISNFDAEQCPRVALILLWVDETRAQTKKVHIVYTIIIDLTHLKHSMVGLLLFFFFFLVYSWLLYNNIHWLLFSVCSVILRVLANKNVYLHKYLIYKGNGAKRKK